MLPRNQVWIFQSAAISFGLGYTKKKKKKLTQRDNFPQKHSETPNIRLDGKNIIIK